MRIKICGITRQDQGETIARLGATSLGFICVPSSPRFVSTDEIAAIISALPASKNCVGVFAGSEIDLIVDVVAKTGLSGVQLHGDETPDFCEHLRRELTSIEIIKALRIKDLNALENCQNYYDHVDTLLLDAYHPNLLGGTGNTLDWHILKEFKPPVPWLLAGGLTPDNIRQALTELHPDGIDLSSGVEKSPGDKDIEKVARLFEQLRVFLD